MPINNLDVPPAVSFFLPKDMLTRFVTVLQAGFYRDAEQGDTLGTFLSALPGFTSGYITDHLQTIFLNGDAVDDTEIGFSETSSTLALSAAMPGLAGSILRKNSPHAALRKNQAPLLRGTSGKKIRVRVKLFNAIAIERGPELLEQGVIFKTTNLISFLELRPSLINGMDQLSFNGTVLPSAHLITVLAEHDEIILKVYNT